jgi:hypothetical protein
MDANRARICGVVCLIGLAALPAAAMFMVPPEAPVDRLIQNVGAYVKEHPKDPMGYYTLARVHHLAFALKQEKLRATEEKGKLPNVPAMFNGIPAREPNVSDKALGEHLLASMENYGAALAKDADNPLFHLGMASVLESALSSNLELPPIPRHKSDQEIKDWKPVYLNESIRHYRKAYDGSIDKDLKIEHVPVAGLGSLISFEAGTHYLALAKRPEVEKELTARADAVKAGVDKLKAKPLGPVSPIIFSLSTAGRLDDLLDPSRAVKFDLDGTGRGQAWPWVKTNTAILVWAPDAGRRASRGNAVQSGRELFGSVTWWIFWRDGYAALDALDDDRDGRLSGDELRGLAVWIDRNGNGVAEAGEVTPIVSLGVESIDVRWTGRDGESPCNRAGLTMKDGRVLPTFDWVAHPIDAAQVLSSGR